MNVRLDDTGVTLAIGLGAFVTLAGVATLVGMPWQYQPGGVVLAAGRILGALLSIGIGIGVAWVILRTR